MKLEIHKSFLPVIIIGLLAAIAVGCQTVDLKAVESFGKATENISQSATKAFELVDEARVKQKTYDVALDLKKSPTWDDTFVGTFQQEKLQAHMESRRKALKALEDYASSISKLAALDLSEDLNTASTELNSSLGSLAATVSTTFGVSDGGLSNGIPILSTIVYGIGSLEIDRIKQTKLTEAIRAADPFVQRVATGIQEDFLAKKITNKDYASFAAANLENASNSLRQAFIQESSSGDLIDMHERLDRLSRMRDERKNIDTVKKTIYAVGESGQKIGEAHKKLLESLGTDHALSTADVYTAVSNLVAKAKEIQAFYASVKPEESEGN